MKKNKLKLYMKNLISIIMPNFNTPAKFLKRALDSVLAQTYNSWELLITDDGSTDKSLSIIKHYTEKDPRIKLFKNEFGKGPAGARNTSIKHVKGRFIAFLDSDDQWLPFHLSERVDHMQKNDYAFTYSWYEKIDEAGKKIGEHKPEKTKVSYKYLLTDCIIGCLSAIYDTEKVGKVYMPQLRKRQDFALWLQILKKVDYAYLYPKITAVYTVRKNSISSNKFKLIKYNWAIYRDVEKFSILKSLYYFSIYLFRYFKRKILK